ncbi:MAG: hypothetical protein JNK38_22405 [Acidobacteria bacterium]|nr:hypothetical protein [Acidobacteriota bacterium]
MYELLSKFGFAAFSFLFGALLNRWWDRARPLVVLQGFSTLRESGKEVEYPDELQQITGDTWFSDRFPPKKASLRQIEEAYKSGKDWAPLLEVAVDKAATSWLTKLENKPSDEDVKNILQEIFSDQGMNVAFSNALVNEDLKIKQLDETRTACLEIVETQQNNGAYLIPWRKSPSLFGANLIDFPFLKSRYQPLIDAVRHLNKDSLSQAVKDIMPIIEKQIRILNHIKTATDVIVKDNTHWAAKIWMANYGRSPMVISPGANLVVTISEQRISVGCDLYTESISDSGKKIEKLVGLFVLEPGKKAVFWAITTGTQEKITNGKVLRTLYEDDKGDTKAFVQLRISGKAILRKKISSNKTSFKDNLRCPIIYNENELPQ